MAEASYSRFKTFHFSYEFQGSRWGIEIPAKTEAEAKARLLRIAHANLDGEVVAKIGLDTGPVSRFLGKLGLRPWSHQEGG